MRRDQPSAAGKDTELRARADDSAVPPAADNDTQTLWIAALDEYVLPKLEEQTVLLVLHALLIQGALSAGHLGLVLPIVGESNVLPALQRAGFVQRDEDGCFSCCAAAYPKIRARLALAGFPVGRL